MFEELPDILTAKQIAKALHCSDRTVLNLAQRGKIPHYRVGSRRLFRKIDVVNYVEKQIAASTKEDTEKAQPELTTK